MGGTLMIRRHMLAPVLVMTMLLVSSLVDAGSYVIELQNGRVLTTSHVWEEGEEIRFSVYGGTSGVPKAAVKAIKASASVSKERRSSGPAPLSPREPPPPMTNAAAGKGATAETTLPRGAGDVSSHREQKVALTDHVDEARKRYLEASSTKDPEAKQRAMEDLRDASKQFYELADHVKAENGGALPAWWHE
jgi:hypothetical protein